MVTPESTHEMLATAHAAPHTSRALAPRFGALPVIRHAEVRH
jgi:hypothetical protein